jgi:aspartate-semialdehyde dehydrogenase
VCVTAEFGQLASAAEVIAVMESFAPSQAVRELPSSPPNALRVRLESDRPQPRRDRESGGGMTTVVGRVRGDSLLHVRYVVLSHNTIKGAAGGSLQNAELLLSQGLI